MNDSNKITVIIADDHDVYRDGLKILLGMDKEISVIGEASDGKRLVELAKKLHPDVILTDLKMPEIDGVQAIKKITEAGCSAKCIALSTFDSDQLIIEALEAGAMGYVIKNAQRGEIIEAVKSVYGHKPYYCKSTTSKLAIQISKSRYNPYKTSTINLFNEKEKEIIRLVCQEKTSEEIGKILFMSKRTVEAFRARILRKMNVKTTAGVAIYAMKNGFYFVEN